MVAFPRRPWLAPKSSPSSGYVTDGIINHAKLRNDRLPPCVSSWPSRSPRPGLKATLKEDHLSGVGHYISAVFVDPAGDYGKPVLLSGFSLSGLAAGNYSLAALSALASADIRMPAVPSFAYSELLHRTSHAETAIETTASFFTFAEQKVTTAPIVKSSDQQVLSQTCGL